jgi:required for meiotic nuclear division protein 1
MSDDIIPAREVGTIVTPAETEGNRLAVQVSYFESPIDVQQLRVALPLGQILQADPLLLRLQGKGYVMVLPFGGVVFWGCSDEVCASVLGAVQRLPGMKERVREASDDLMVLLDQSEDRVTFRDIWLRKLTVEHIKIISRAFAQSAALKYCELSVGQALANVAPLVAALKAHGQLPRSDRDILKLVGFTLDMRETLLAKLTLFDEPAEAWSSERFARLHSLLYEHFDIRSRLAGLQAKLDFLADLNQVLTNLLQHYQSRRLELVVIALIVLEVLIALFEFFVHR